MSTQYDTPYGSDPSGLICGYLFDANSPGMPINSDEVAAWLNAERPESDTGFVWLHFNLANTGTIPWLKNHLHLSESFYDSLKEVARSTSVEYTDGALLAVVNDVLFDFSFDPGSVSSLWLSADARLIITARNKPLKSIDRLRLTVNQGELFRSTVEVLVHLLRDQADVLVQIVRETTRRIDVIEDGLLAKRLSVSRADLGALRRMLVRLRRLLAPEPAAMFRLLNRPPSWMLEVDVLELRHSTEEFSAVISDMATLIERVKLLQEEIAAMVNEQDNRSLFVLTVVTVTALPFNVIGGLLGMNVGGIPFANHPHGFAYTVLIVAVFTALVALFAFRNRHH